MRKGWFSIPGVQRGDRSVEEQMLGLEPALAAARGATVLDLGAAEGLIAREFAKAGASVTAIEMVGDHVTAARIACRGYAVEIIQSELKDWIERHPDPRRYDIVLALGIAHKLHDPGQCMTFAARSARHMVVFRGPGKDTMYWDGWLAAKFGEGKIPPKRCHVPTLMAEEGFTEGETLPSARGERVQYWLRQGFGIGDLGLRNPQS